MAAAVLLAPGESLAADGAATTPAAEAPTAQGTQGTQGTQGATLATGERVELVEGKDAGTPGFRVVPQRAGEQSGRYAFSRVDGGLQVRPVGLKKPVRATTVTTGAAPKAAPARSARAAAAAYSVRIQLAGTDHFGPIIHVWDRKTWTYHDVAEEQWDSFGTVSLPPGDYVTIGMFSNWRQPTHLLTKTFTVKDRGLTVSLDASTAKETGITTDDPTARRSNSAVWIRVPNGGIAGFMGGWGEKVYVTPISLPGVSLRVHDVLTKDGTSDNNPSPYRYDLFHSFDGTVPANPTRVVRTADLAKTVTTVRSQGRDALGYLSTAPDTGQPEDGVYVGSPIRVPATVTEYVTPDRPFSRLVQTGSHMMFPAPRTLAKGTHAGETLGLAPFASRGDELASVRRLGSRFQFYDPRAFSDGAGNQGSDHNSATQDMVLSANGTLLAEVKGLGYPKVWQATTTAPNQRTGYRLVQTIHRTANYARLSHRQTTEWTFFSQGAQSRWEDVPMVDAALRVDGLDARNTAGASPVTVTATADSRLVSATATVTGLEYSADDGATWTALPVPGTGDTASAELTVPQDARFVSLRVTAKDTEGSTVRRTVERAFAGPVPTADETVGAVTVTDVSVNGGRVIAPPVGDYAEYPARFTVSDPSGVADTFLYLYRGSYTRPDGVITAWKPQCSPVNATTSTCETTITIDARRSLGRNDLSGEWKVAIGARSLDGIGFTDRGDAGTALVLRQSRVTMTAPAQATKGKLFAVQGIAGLVDWSTGRWNALKGQPVQLEYRKPGVSAWTVAAKVTADASGIVKATPKAEFDANWRWLMPRTGEIGAAASPVFFVDVR
ncbi:hypothetical protein ACIQMR_23985 [Streptomyces sp. NPDC091376]|uniref:hypothetical protein n=1 Tax=Streptomyces sp. NPDC091376 TaxID=3365994 RepID=UPI00380406C1